MYHRRMMSDVKARKVVDIKVRKVLFGNNVSHAHNKTRRKFNSNMHQYRVYLGKLGTFVNIKCPVSELRRIEKRGELF